MIDGLQVGGLVNYRQVRYRNIWPNTDVYYYGTGRDLEYDIVLQPGADLRKVQLRFNGIQSLRTNAAGDLLLRTAEQEFVQHRPRIYQQVGNRRVEIAGRYRIGQDQRVSFEVGQYDHTKELVIDSILAYRILPLTQLLSLPMESRRTVPETPISQVRPPDLSGRCFFFPG